jgi:hypothetical protein
VGKRVGEWVYELFMTTLDTDRFLVEDVLDLSNGRGAFEAHGMRNELSLRLKWLHRAVQCSHLVLTRGEIELCESSSSRQAQLMHLALPNPSVTRKRHESAMTSVIGRGVRNGSAASCTRESHEGRSHASSTSESQLVAQPVGQDGDWKH